MNVYNSSYDANPVTACHENSFDLFVCFFQDETDMTMINHSFIYRPTDEPIGSCVLTVRRLQHSNTAEEKHDLNSWGPIGDIEDILHVYCRDLQQMSNTNFFCDQQLTSRLIDLLRPAYSADDQRKKELDQLYDNIVDLQKNRLSQQKEKDDQLYTEIHELRTSIMTQSVENAERRFQRMSKSIFVCRRKGFVKSEICSLDPVMDSDQWLNFEQETAELQRVVQLQNKQIEQLIELLLSKSKHS